MNLKEFISAGNTRYLAHIDEQESMEAFYASKDWKELTCIKYRFFCQVADEAGIDAREFGMPDGENCPRAFREWIQEVTVSLWDMATGKNCIFMDTEASQKSKTIVSKTIVTNEYVTVAKNGDHVIVDMVNATIYVGGICFSAPQITIGVDQEMVVEVRSNKTTGESTCVVIDHGRVDYLKQS